jgi:hypothetical protein
MSQKPDLIDFNTTELRAIAGVAIVLSRRDGDRHDELLRLARGLTDEELAAVVGIATTVAPFGADRRELMFEYLSSGQPLVSIASINAAQRQVM